MPAARTFSAPHWPIAVGLITTAGLLLEATPLLAQLPAAQLAEIFPAGANAGSSVEVTVAGGDLDEARALHFSHPGITAERKLAEPGPFDDGPQPVDNTFIVSIAPDVPLGSYDVRFEGKYGVSNPRIFEIGGLPETVETEPNDTTEDTAEVTLPVTINGRLDRAADVDQFSFRVRRGQRILLDCRGRRIDSGIDPVIVVSDQAGRELAYSREGHAGEPLIDFVAEQDGIFVARISDSLFRGGPGYAYRLSIGELPHIDGIFPPAGVPGQRSSFTVYGRNLPGGKPTDMMVDGARLEERTVQIDVPREPPAAAEFDLRFDAQQAFVDGFEYRIDAGAARSNPLLIGLATAAPIAEAEPNDEPHEAHAVTVPCEIAGRFSPRRDQDWYAFEAGKGDVFFIELFFNRLGFPGDPLLVVQQVTKKNDGTEQTRNLATADDSGHLEGGRELDTRCGDPIYRLETPEDGLYRLQVQDGYSSLRDDPRQVYRLAIRRPQPDFRLAAVPTETSGGLVLRRGGHEAITIVAERRDGFEGEITVSATDLPNGVTAHDVVIGPTVHATTLVLTAAENAPASVSQIRIAGRAQLGDQQVQRHARVVSPTAPLSLRRPNQTLNSVPSRLTRGLTLTVSADEPAIVAFQTDSKKVWETSRAGILKVPFQVTRRGDYKGTIQTEVRHLPANVNRVNFSIASGKDSGEMQIPLRSNTPTGTYTLHVAGFVQNMPYRHNVEAAEAAAERKKELDRIASETVAAAKAADTAKTQAENEAKKAATELADAERIQKQAQQAVTEKQQALQAAQQALDRAGADAKRSPDDKRLAETRSAATKAAADAKAAEEAAVKAAAEAQQKLTQARQKSDTADEQLRLAMGQAAEAAERAKAADDAKKIADKRATDTANAAKQRNINFWVHATPLTIKITPAPVTIKPPADELRLEQGASVNLPLTIERKYDYQDQVSLTASIPGGVSGLSFKNTSVPKGQQKCDLALTAASNATPGVHELTLTASMRVNNQTVTIELPLLVRVAESEKEAG